MNLDSLGTVCSRWTYRLRNSLHLIYHFARLVVSWKLLLLLLLFLLLLQLLSILITATGCI